MQEYIITECDAEERLIPSKKKTWLIGITNAPRIRNIILSLLSILKFCFRILKTMNKSIVAIPNLMKARESGDIWFTTNLAAIGVNEVENIK